MTAEQPMAHAFTPVIRFAPAKLNLTLAIIRRRPDGFHDLHSIMVALELADALTVSPAVLRASRRESQPVADTLRVSGFDAGPVAENLVLRAIAAARAAVRDRWPGAPADPPPLAARLVKRIPVAAGLGGGSSDAASAVDAALEAWDTTLSAHAAMTLATQLGSDVPFFFSGGTALVTGRGEHVQSLPGVVGPPPGVLLVTPRVPISTAAAYAVYDGGARLPVAGAARMTSEHLAGELARGLTSAALLDRAAVLAAANDMLPGAVTIAPQVLVFRRALSRLLGRPVGQSGSGPTGWVLYPSQADAERAARLVRSALRDGRLPAAGDGEPFVAATRFATPEDEAASAARGATSPTVAGDPPH